jgi:hypothetical protein
MHQVKDQLVDEAIQCYVDWREACFAVWDACEQWASSPSVDAATAFSAYRAALDREECAAQAYADLLARIAAGKGWTRELEPTDEAA